MRSSATQTRHALALAGVVFTLATGVFAQGLKPLDVGTSVNGFQDDFSGATLGANWLIQGASVYSVNNGVLRVTTASGDPNHLLYAAPGYNNTVQEVLLRLRVLNFGTGDLVRCGAGVGVDPATGQGINFLLRDHTGEGQTGRHTAFLDDARAWGPGFAGTFQNNVWYWIRLRQEPNAGGGSSDVFAKFWKADGTEAEPASWSYTWDYTPTRTTRTGYAGITAGSGGVTEFEVDYALIKASGLPSIVVNPEAFPAFQLPAAITNEPADVTVGELMPASFAVGASGYPPLSYQWYQNGQPLTGATQPTLSLPRVLLADDHAQFHVVVSNFSSNANHSATSRVATLRVVADTTPPLVREAHSEGLSAVAIRFSEAISPNTATNLAAYAVTDFMGTPLAVQTATVDYDGTTVTLQVEPMTEGQPYYLTLNGLTDQSAARNPITPGTQIAFVALAVAWHDFEGTVPAGSVAVAAGGYDVRGGGGGADEGFFAWTRQTGDFDVRVRVAALDPTDAWARAGLMARESLDSGAAFVAAFATPSISGCYFQSQDDGNVVTEGAFPANYPATWLRLRREEEQFTGYASRDGQSWTRLGGVTLPLAQTLHLGFVVSSRDTNRLTTAAFRDFSPVTTATAVSPPPIEPLGQASRRTGLVISEIMYHPAPGPAGSNRLEFIELCNTRAEPEDLSGFRLSGDIAYTFPANTILPGGGFLVVARYPDAVQQAYGLEGVLGPFTNNLPNNSGTIRLRHRTGAVFLEVKYGSKPPWPAAADGAGHSLVLARPSYGLDSPLAWAASDQPGGSPGRLDPFTDDPLRAVVINEFLARSAGLIGHDFIELYNRGAQDLDLGGCVLSDTRHTNQFVIPAGTIIRGRGFVSFSQFQMGFSLDATGAALFLRAGSGGRVLDAVRYGPQAAEVSLGRAPDGAPVFDELVVQTPGTNNAPPLIRDIVINEIMYAPISGAEDDQYVELYNRGTNTLNIGGWRFVDGISFQFPPNTIIGPQSYLVVAKNLTNLLAKYPNLNTNNAVGDFAGALSGRGERVALALFEASLVTNALVAPRSLAAPPEPGASGNLIIDPPYNPDAYVVVDEVTYGAGGRWGQWHKGGGSSLELTDPRSDNRLAPNWADSDETAKAQWTTITYTGTVDNGNVAADSLQILLLGAGECLVDDVRLLNSSSVNVVPNSTFDAGLTGWVAEGTLATSGWEPASGTNSPCLHLRAVDRGDNQVNRIRISLSSALASGSTATIQARVRWLKGHPEILFRVRGNWLETAARMNLPPDLGTPGAPNSRLAANSPPAIYDVAHFPVLPAAGEPVRVTARLNDPDGLSAVTLYYRIDPASAYTTVAMTNAGSGVYRAWIPGQSAGALAAFYVHAADGQSPSASATFPNDAPARECLVRFGETMPAGNLPAYRLWMTQNTFNNWTARHKLNNTPNDITFVLGQDRVIYNAQALFAGSPYIAPGFSTPSGNRCGYSIALPPDDRLFGDTDLVLDWPGGHGGETTAIQEQMAYWIADQMGLPFSYRHFIRLYVNGVSDLQRGGVFEAVLQPAGDYLEQWSPDQPEGEFYKIDRAFEFNDAGSRVADPMPRLQIYATTGGQKKTARYRWTWLKRSYDSALDYTNLFTLVDALNAAAPEPYTTATEKLVDVEQWMGVFAFEHVINNFDSWGHEIGKNMYTFKPTNGKWVLYPFDLDWLMLVSPRYSSSYANGGGQLFISEDPTVTRMYDHPPFRRAYLRAVERAVNGPLLNSVADPVMDAKYRTLVNNGVTMCDGQSLTSPSQVKTWFAQRRSFLQNQLAVVAAPFALSNTNFTVGSNLVTLAGTAPVAVKAISVNGVTWLPTWTSVSNWTVRLPVAAATNELEVVGVDPEGRAATAALTATVLYTGSTPPPQGLVVFNEIMAQPPVPGAEYVELYNASQNYTFELTGWRINGLDYRFPEGSLLEPNRTLVLAKDAEAFASAYGATQAVYAVYAGNLQADGETLTLLRPGAVPGAEEIVDQVRYEARPPWPTAANGAAWQRVDPQTDGRRVLNWSDGTGWQFVAFSVTNQITNAVNVQIRVKSAGDIYLDDLRVETGRIVGEGTNLLVNGDFESPLNVGWLLGSNVLASTLSTDLKHSGNSALHLVASARANTVASGLSQLPLPLEKGQVYTVSFWFLPSANLTNIDLYCGFSVYSNNIATLDSLFRRTPAAPNLIARALPVLPPVWLNEVQPENLTGPTNSLGERAAWIELYNSGTNAVNLEGWHLANNYTNLTQWAFPPGASLAPGQLAVVWADGHPELTDATHWHTSFSLAPGSGSVALVMPALGSPAVLDYLNYTNLASDWSFGSYPDGQPCYRRGFHYVSPGASNNPAWPALPVVINEWMADNTSALGDPADHNFEDWFELYNTGATDADLSGYYLSDNLANPFQFRIPEGWVIPPGGFLLVWADNESGQNLLGATNLHVNFALNKAGEAIGLFTPDGALVDAVTFGVQSANLAEGRYPDGAADLWPLPEPTPGAANAEPLLDNARPVVDPVATQNVLQGQTLALDIMANDSDWPPQNLVFSLGIGAPPGMSITPAGHLTWTPGADAPASNRVQVIVQDDGFPPLSASTWVIILVAGPPQFTPGHWQLDGNSFNFEFSTLPGRTYQLEYSESLSHPDWRPLGDPVTASGAAHTFQDAVAGVRQRFYRVVVVGP